MKSIDPLLSKVRDGERYQCAHFMRDAWLYVTGHDFEEAFDGFLEPAKGREARRGTKAAFDRLNAPEGLCVAVMRGFSRRPHVGLWYQGSLLHLGAQHGEFLPEHVLRRTFKKISFYRPVITP